MTIDFQEARLQAHWAAQLASAPGSTLLPEDAEFHHTNLAWADGCLVGREVNGAAARLEVATLTLRVGDAAFPLVGRTYADGEAWVSERFGAPVKRSPHDMLPHPVEGGAPFAGDAALPALADAFDAAAAALATLGPEVRVWPHHFDIAALTILGGGRSVGAGLSPGDEWYAQPYWYISPWPYPEDRTNLPDLPAGSWHTTGWVGAKLDYVPEVDGGAFLRAAREIAAGLAGA